MARSGCLVLHGVNLNKKKKRKASSMRRWSPNINLFKIVSSPTTKNKFWECETLRGENDNPLSTIIDKLNQEINAWKTLASLQSN